MRERAYNSAVEITGKGKAQQMSKSLRAETMQNQLRLDFTNLPLIEAAARFTFEQPIELTYGLINGLAEILRSDFPQMGELDGIEPSPGIPPHLRFQFPKLPGAVYRGGQKGLSVSIQSQLLAARWLRQVASDAPPYPRFAALKGALTEAHQGLSQLTGSGRPAVSIVNMVYVNLVHPEDPRKLFRDYFAKEVHVGLLEPAQLVHEFMLSWREDDEIDLRLHLQAVETRIDDRTRSGFRLATAGGLRVSPADDVLAALTRIHDRLQVFFRDLLSDRAKTEWGLRE